jgi:hypothetical protein
MNFITERCTLEKTIQARKTGISSACTIFTPIVNFVKTQFCFDQFGLAKWRRGITYGSGTKDPGSNAAMLIGSRKVLAMMLLDGDLTN